VAAEIRDERWEAGIIDPLRRIGFRIGEGARVDTKEVTFAVLAMQRMLHIEEDPPGPRTAAAIARAAVDWDGIRAPLVLECSTEPDGPAVCAALRLTPRLVVTPGDGASEPLRFVRSPFWTRPVIAETDTRLVESEHGEGRRPFTVLELHEEPDDHSNSPATDEVDFVESPRTGSRWKALHPGTTGGVITGVVRAGDSVASADVFALGGLADTDAAVMLPGTPLFVDDRVAGMWSRSRGVAIPASSLRRVVAQLFDRGQAPERPLRERDRIFRDLNDDALSAFAFAEGLRLAMQEDAVHLGQLAIALYRVPGSEGARLLASVKYTPEQLASDLWGEGAIANLRQAQPAPLDRLPALSENAWEAVSVAARTARAHGAPHISPRHLFYGLLSVDKSRATQHLVGLGIKKEDVALGVPPAPPVDGAASEISPLAWRSARPGVASDTVAGQEDLLGLGREVEVLCSVIAARDVEPPLSIGLFGDWGTGKTFFMEQMHAWIERMKKQARNAIAAPTAYCTNVVQLRFNAWHYIDANLWASLTAEIFDGLGRALGTEAALKQAVDDPERARARLMTAAASARDVLAEAERRKSAAEADTRAIEQRLSSLAASESAIAGSLVTAAVDVARAQPEVKETLEQAGKLLGVSALRASSKELQSQVQQLRGVAGTLRGLWMAARQFRWRTVVLVGLASIAGVAIWKVLSSSALRLSLDAATMRLAGGITFLTTLVTPYLPRVLRAKKLVDDTLKKHQDTLAAAEAARRSELAEQQASVRQQMEVAEQSLGKARAAVDVLERQLAELRADTLMSEFVAERRESTDYTQHLGVVARARRDFERLSNLLEQVRNQKVESAGAAQLPRIDRIVLYIDDLDRCPEDKVVDVLQAVHLLLAFRLFVVVVGVDSRWLLHSLKRSASVFRQVDQAGDEMSEEEQIHWRSTPLNYLEKIFQIPFSLRPMESGGFERLIQSLAPAEPPGGAEAGSRPAEQRAPAARPDPAPRPPSSAAAPADAGPKAKDPAAPRPAAVTAPATEAAASTPPAGPPAASGEDAPIDLNPAHLKITAAEQELMKKLFPFIPSPRAAKRLVNVYRLLRATVGRDEWSTFLGGDGDGDFRAVLLLLALLTGYPSEGTDILRDLVEDPPGGTWWQAVAAYAARGGAADDPTPIKPAVAGGAVSQAAERARWRELLAKLGEARALGVVDEQVPCAVFSAWARRVARYSFESGRIALARREGIAQAQPKAATATTATSTTAAR
jgi:hypothetical protein